MIRDLKRRLAAVTHRLAVRRGRPHALTSGEMRARLANLLLKAALGRPPTDQEIVDHGGDRGFVPLMTSAARGGFLESMARAQDARGEHSRAASTRKLAARLTAERGTP